MDPGPTYVEVARATSERGELVLRERRLVDAAAAWELRANGMFVMDTVETATEQALAEVALELTAAPGVVLVGGLGLGFTVAAVLTDPRVQRCVAVELEPALVAWMRDGTVPHGPALLDDDRVETVIADLGTVLTQAAPASYDLILLDVDNGPDQLVHESNGALYEPAGLRAALKALRPGGTLAVWSAAAAPELADNLTEVFGGVQARPLPVHLQQRAEQYWLYVARAPAVGSGP